MGLTTIEDRLAADVLVGRSGMGVTVGMGVFVGTSVIVGNISPEGGMGWVGKGAQLARRMVKIREDNNFTLKKKIGIRMPIEYDRCMKSQAGAIPTVEIDPTDRV